MLKLLIKFYNYFLLQITFKMKYANKKIIGLVSGTNQGIGKFLALQLLKNNPESKFLFTTYENIQKTLKQTPQFVEYKNKGKMILKNLDLMNQDNIQKFVSEVKNQNWKFDAIVNNAAMGFDQGDKIPDLDWARRLMKTNIYGTINFTNSLLPYLNKNGRIVNVSSRFGALRNHPQFIVRRFTDPDLEEKTIFQGAQEFISLCEKGEMGTRFKSAYGTSKMMLNAWSRIIMKKKLKHGQVSLSMSPGRCTTQMRKRGGVHSAESGAKAVYDCIFMQNPSFDIFYHRWQKADFIKCGPQIDGQDEFSHFKG